MQAIRTGSDIDSNTVKNVLLDNTKLEEQNLSLKEHISELNQRLEKLESGRGSALSHNARTSGGSRASKVVTPVQIRDMPLKKYKADVLASNTFQVGQRVLDREPMLMDGTARNPSFQMTNAKPLLQLSSNS